MQQVFGLSIANDVSVEDILTLTDFPYSAVIDLRSTPDGRPVAMSERVVRTLRQFFIGFEQKPTDLDQATVQDVTAFMDRAKDMGGDVLILTTQMRQLAELCDERFLFHRRARLGHPKLHLVEGGKTQISYTEKLKTSARCAG